MINSLKLTLKTGAVVAACFCLASCMKSPSAEDSFSVKIGDTAPEFFLENTDGKIVSSESMAGKPYVVAVFATWCPPCKMELTSLEADVWQPLKDQGINVIGINYGDEDAGLIRRFAEDNGLTFPMLTDESGSYRKSVGARMLPQSLVIGPDGKIIDLHVGFTDESIAATAQALKDALK